MRDVAVGVVGLAQRVSPIVSPAIQVSVRATAAADRDLTEREALLGLAVVVGAGRGELHAVCVHHDLLGDAVARAVVDRLSRRCRW
jgi:hypothetical protein